MTAVLVWPPKMLSTISAAPVALSFSCTSLSAAPFEPTLSLGGARAAAIAPTGNAAAPHRWTVAASPFATSSLTAWFPAWACSRRRCSARGSLRTELDFETRPLPVRAPARVSRDDLGTRSCAIRESRSPIRCDRRADRQSGQGNLLGTPLDQSG